MNWLVDNWFFIILGIAVICLCITLIINFIRQPREQQLKSLKEWLKYAVFEAEKQFGTKTGQLKLRYVYGLFIQQFPKIADIISFETFSNWVDEALVWLDGQLSNNSAVINLVGGDSNENRTC